MPYRTFTRTWWKNVAETVPAAGRKNYSIGDTYDNAAAAREACRQYNVMRFGPSQRGKRGLCMEYEQY